MIVINLAADVKESLVDLHRRSTDACVRRRAAIVLDLAEGLGATRTARRQRVARTTVYDMHRLWERHGIVALFDGRSGNGPVKNERMIATSWGNTAGTSKYRSGVGG